MKINKEFETLHLDKDELYAFISYKDGDPYQNNWLSYGDFHKHSGWTEEDVWYMPNLMSGSDYGGDTVTKSNYLAMKEYAKRSKFVKEVSGGHGTYALAFNVSRLKGKFALELVDIFKGLESYSLVDEEALSQLEGELENEYWENDLSGDFKKELMKYLGNIGITIDDLGDDNEEYSLRNIYRELMERTNTEVLFETGCSVYVDLDRLFSDRDKVNKVIGDKDLLRWLLVFDSESQLEEAFVRLFRKDEDYPITLSGLVEKWGDLSEIDKRLSLFDRIYEEWCLNALSFDDKEELATLTGETGSTGKYYYLYSILKEMEK